MSTPPPRILVARYSMGQVRVSGQGDMRDRILNTLRNTIDLSVLPPMGLFAVAAAFHLAVWGSGDMHDDEYGGWYTAYLFGFALLPFFILNVIYLLACLMTGAGFDRERDIYLYMSAAPVAATALAFVKAKTLSEATAVGLLLCFTLVNVMVAGWGLWWLYRWALAKWRGGGAG